MNETRKILNIVQSVVYICVLIVLVDGFNMSPQPIKVIRPPKHLQVLKTQERSPYFGFSMVMRKSR